MFNSTSPSASGLLVYPSPYLSCADTEHLTGLVSMDAERRSRNWHHEFRLARDHLLWQMLALDDHRPNALFQQVQDSSSMSSPSSSEAIGCSSTNP